MIDAGDTAWLITATALVLFMTLPGLALFYASAPAYDVSDTSRIVPIFALNELPPGLRGLLFAGLFAAAM